MLNPTKKIEILTLITALTISFVGFHSQPVQAKEAKYEIYIISHGGPGDPFWGTVIKGVRDADAILDGVKAHYLSPEVYSIDKILDFLETAVASKPAGIGVTVTNYAPLDEPLRRIINKKNIPVIAFNVADTRPVNERIPYLSYIGQSPYSAGKVAGERMLEGFKPTRAVVAIHSPGHSALEDRAQGITDVLKKKGIPVEKLDITMESQKAVGILKSYLIKYPETDAIFTLGPAGTHPAIQVIKEESLEDRVKIGAFDLSEGTLKSIKKGTVLYTIDQQPYLQGYLTVLWLYLHVNFGFNPPEEIPTGPSIVDETNVGKVIKFVEKGYR